MDFSYPENSSSASAEDHHDLIKKAIQVSINGRQLATQLLILTGSGKPCSSISSSDSGCYADDGSSAANDLLVKILESFTHSISILNHAMSDKFSNQLTPNTPVLVSSPSYWDGRKSEEDSDESSKTTTSSLKQRRGCYKRRKTSHTWTKITPTLIDDGHAWRKYGQKVILNAKHPRNYFRCTHKFDQGCQATKQVQKTEEADGDPPMYRTTYHGYHTCRSLLIKSPHHQIILMQQDFSTTPTPTPTPTAMDSPGVLLSFGSPNTNHKSHQQPSFFPNFPCSSLTKQEHEDIKKPCSLNHNDQSVPSDFLLSPTDHLTTTKFEPSAPLTTVLSSGSDHDHGDVISNSEIYSCTASTHSDHHGFDVDMDMDMVLAGPVKFDDDALQFEFE